MVFAGQKIPLERPRVRTREGQEVELESYGQLQQDGKLQRAVREGVVAGLSTRNYRRAVESVLEGYGIEKSSVSRQFVEASSNQLRVLCERRLEDLNLVVLMIDGIHFGGQVLVVALGIAEGGEKHVLGVWQGATENTTVVKGLLEDLVDRGLVDCRKVTITSWYASKLVWRQTAKCPSPATNVRNSAASLNRAPCRPATSFAPSSS